MSCGICSNTLNPCPVCHSYAAPKAPASAWEERLDARRHQGSHETAFNSGNLDPAPAAHGLYAIDNDGDRIGPKYQREWNSGYDGPGKGTW